MTLRIVNKRVNIELSNMESRFKRNEKNGKIVIEIEPYFKFIIPDNYPFHPPTLYIKDKNEWEKDDKTKIKQSITDVANKKRKAIREWTDAHPDWMESGELQQEYVQLVNRVMESIEDNDNGENKIIKNIAKQVIINK